MQEDCCDIKVDTQPCWNHRNEKSSSTLCGFYSFKSKTSRVKTSEKIKENRTVGGIRVDGEPCRFQMEGATVALPTSNVRMFGPRRKSTKQTSPPQFTTSI